MVALALWLGFWSLDVLSIFSRRRIHLGSLWVLVLQGGGYGSEDQQPATCIKAHGPSASDALNTCWKTWGCTAAKIMHDTGMNLLHSVRVQETSHFFVFLRQIKSGSEP